jgi:hypothetical protein
MSAVYDGAAGLRVHDVVHGVRVRLTGHLDPIDGRYHWRGMVFDLTSEVRIPQTVHLSIGDHAAEGQLTEVTPWGTYCVAGVGLPPYTVGEVTAIG